MHRTVYCLIFLMLLITPGASTENGEVLVFHRKNVQDKDADGWYPAISTEGHFSVKMPRPFNDGTGHIRDSVKGEISLYVIANPLTGDGWEHAVTEMEFNGDWNKIDIESIARNLAGSDGRIGSVVKTASEESIEGEKGGRLTSGVRFKAVHSLPYKRVFLVICGYPRFSGAKAATLCPKFIQSFQLK